MRPGFINSFQPSRISSATFLNFNIAASTVNVSGKTYSYVMLAQSVGVTNIPVVVGTNTCSPAVRE